MFSAFFVSNYIPGLLLNWWSYLFHLHKYNSYLSSDFSPIPGNPSTLSCIFLYKSLREEHTNTNTAPLPRFGRC